MGGIFVFVLIAGFTLFYLKKRRGRRPQEIDPAEPIRQDTTMAERGESTLQEADQGYERPAELETRRLFEMEGNYLPELGDRERQVP